MVAELLALDVERWGVVEWGSRVGRAVSAGGRTDGRVFTSAERKERWHVRAPLSRVSVQRAAEAWRFPRKWPRNNMRAESSGSYPGEKHRGCGNHSGVALNDPTARCCC